MEVRIMFSDIDGTILNTDHRLSQRTLRCIQAVCRQGIPFVLVSARMPRGVYAVQKQLGIRQPIIAYSGGLLLDENGKTLRSVGFSPSQAMEVKGYLDDLDVFCGVYSGDQWYVNDASNPWVRQEVDIAGIEPIQCGDPSLRRLDGVVHKILVMADASRIPQVEESIKRHFPTLVTYRSKDTYLEIVDRSVSKSGAVKELCRTLGIPVEHSVSFGDHFNDIDMLKATGLGYAMANAPKEVREAVGHVTKTNDEDGVAYTICKLMGWKNP